ncbi:MAG: prepilin-type N-terminal cleavage/methylation domain-containing protein [Patescibacteria group bacterium]
MRKGFTLIELVIVVAIVAIVAAVTILRLMAARGEHNRYVILAELVGAYEEPVVYDCSQDRGWLLKCSLDQCVPMQIEKKRAELLEEPVGIPHFFMREVQAGTNQFVFEIYALEWKDGKHILRREERLNPNPKLPALRRTFYRIEPLGDGIEVKLLN